MPQKQKVQLNTTAAHPPKPKTERQMNLSFWGNPSGNKLLNKI